MSNKTPYDILVGPMLTEDVVNRQAMKQPQYTFEVAVSANKREIRWAIETAYGVKVISVNTMLVKGKYKRIRSKGARPGLSKNRKKAIVTLAPEQSINFS